MANHGLDAKIDSRSCAKAVRRQTLNVPKVDMLAVVRPMTLVVREVNEGMFREFDTR